MTAEATEGTARDVPRGAWLFRAVSPATLAAVRIVFGVLMFGQTALTWFRAADVLPEWEYVPTYAWGLSAETFGIPLDVRFLLMVVAAGLVAIGLFTRPAAAVFGGIHAITFVLDPSRFNNHDYLIVLLAGWLVVVRSNAMWSVDARFGSAAREVVPFWQVAALRAQLGLVYFYGGLAKLNGDWLAGEPMRPWLAVERDLPIIGPLMAQPWTAIFVAWFGLVFDLTLPFLLLWRRTRWPAFAVAVLFHLTNSVIFNIGVFPWLGIGTLVVFLDPDSPARWFGRPRSESTPSIDVSPATRTTIRVSLLVFAALQLLMPFRQYLWAGNVEWTEEGKNFSWRMMLSQKSTFVGMQVQDPATGSTYEVAQTRTELQRLGRDPGVRFLGEIGGIQYLVPQRPLVWSRQKRGKGVWGNPKLLARYAHYVADEARAAGIENPRLRVVAIASLNGRPFQFLVDPEVDLGNVRIPAFGTPDWVVPLRDLRPGERIGDYAESDAEFLTRVRRVLDER